jgi:glycosyltransferase 2 family protein
MLIFRKVLICLGPILFLYLIQKTDFQVVLEQFHSIRWPLALAGMVLVAGHIFLKVFRWNFLLNAQQISLSYKESCWIYLAGLFLGVVTPGRVGDFSKAWYLRDKGYRLAKAMVSVFLDRLLDVAFFFIILGTGLILNLEEPVLWLLIWGVFSGAGVWAGKLGLAKSELPFRPLLPRKWREAARFFFEELGRISFKHWIAILFITWCGWLVYFSSITLLSYSIGIVLPFGKAAFAIVLSALVAFLPVSFLGIGTRDGMLIVYFQSLGLQSEQALGFSLCILLVMILTGFYGLFGYAVCPFPLRQKGA